jgi:ABC-type Mn2+/Zn2+ transport system ATPase subunit
VTTAGDTSAITLSNIEAGYDATPVLRELSFSVRRGELVGVVGPNGSGKTTLLKVLLGLIEPTSGTVEILGRRISGSDAAGRSASRNRAPAERARARRLIGYLPQMHAPPALPVTVTEAVLLGRWGHSYAWLRKPGAEDRRVVDECLEMVGMLDFSGRDLKTLSGGQRQRTSLARALARRPEMLLMDEPTTYLDRNAKADLMVRIIELHELLGITTVMVTHEDVPGRSFDRVLRMEEGYLL